MSGGDSVELTSNIFNYTFISLALITFIRAVVLLRKSKIERVLLREDKQILVHIVRFLFMSLIFSIFSLIILAKFYDQNFSEINSNDVLAFIISALIFGFLISTFIYLYAPILPVIYGKKRYYVIDYKEHGKLYILKITSNDQVILSDKRELDVDDAIIIVEKSDILISTPIKCEVEKGNILNDFKKLKDKRKGSKELKA